MRLSVQQMRIIRAMRLKRSEWQGVSAHFAHEHLGEVVFNQGSQNQSKKRGFLLRKLNRLDQRK